MKVAIIGAGMAGIAAGRELMQAGLEVTVFEKSRGIGGRCSTRRWNGHLVDHGAQFLSAASGDFLERVKFSTRDCFRELHAKVLDQSGRIIPTKTGRFYHQLGNNHFVKDFACGLDVRTEHEISDALGLLKSVGGEFHAVLSTAPTPQTAKLFSVPWACEFSPSATAVFDFDGEFVGSTDGTYGIEDPEGDLAWTACENHKAGRVLPGHTVVVAQMSPGFSKQILHLPKDEYPDLILPYVTNRWNISPSLLLDSFGHRWTLASAVKPAAPPALPPGCFVAGDAMLGPGLENSWLSGMLAARQILHSLRTAS